MSEKKTCSQCNQQFEIGDWDIEFLKNISPTFDGEKFDIPMPTLCKECRCQRRMIWRNNRILYRRKCDLCKKETVSMYSGDKEYEVYCNDCWWSDKWSPLDYGRDFDGSRPFFEQFGELQRAVPRIALMNKNPENSEFCNFAGYNKDCYLATSSWNNENCFYTVRIGHCKDCVDCQFLIEGELCYRVVSGSKLYKCFFCIGVYDSSECYFSVDLKGCNHCIFSSNLRNKSYFAYNKPCTKEEFEGLVRDIGNNEKLLNMQNTFKEVIISAIYPSSNLNNCDNCTGDGLDNCKNVKEGFDAFDIQDAKYFINGESAQDVMDGTNIGIGKTQLIYESISTGDGAYNCLFGYGNWAANDCYYCDTVIGSSNCFGSVCMKKYEYCILNKQFSKSDYEKQVAKIINHMKNSGEWGEFFGLGLSPFGYNEAIVNEYFPLSQSDATKLGAKWQENDFSPQYDSQVYFPLNDIDAYIASQEKTEEAVRGVIVCTKSGKPFKIMPNEMVFYIKNNIALPRTHYSVRFDELFNTLNPRRLWERGCMCEIQGHGHDGKCQNRFMTPFSSEREERVYCESCYQKSIV